MDLKHDERSALHNYKYYLLTGVYIAVTSAAFYRVHRQPYHSAIKWEQYETIFKATTLATAIAGFALSGTVNTRRSDTSERTAAG